MRGNQGLGAWVTAATAVLSLTVMACGDKKTAAPGASAGGAAPPAASTSAPTGEGCWSRAACATACSKDDARACARLARYQSGVWGKAPDQEPTDALKKACSLGDAMACLEQVGDEADEAGRSRAKKASDAACKAGDGKGCFVAVSFMPKSDKAERLARTDKACRLGGVQACKSILSYAMGLLMTNGSGEPLPKGAEEAARKVVGSRCRTNHDARACLVDSMLGDDEEVDAEERGIRILGARCDAGHPGSCALRADVLLKLKLDKAAATEAFKTACKAGVKASCRRVAPRDKRFLGRFLITSHTVDKGCDGKTEPVADADDTLSQVFLEQNEPPNNAELSVIGCKTGQTTLDDCSEYTFSATLAAGDTGWEPKQTGSGTQGRPCFKGSTDFVDVSAGKDGSVTVNRTVWGTPPDGEEHPELCAAVKAGRIDQLTCLRRDTLVLSPAGT